MVEPALSRSSVLGPPQGELCFRLRGTARDGQTIRICSTKCTIGSSDRCTLRLRAAGVRSVHCLVLHGVAATVVRCWSPDTLLNGRRFEDGLLVPGDVLTIGPIELEVLSVPCSDFRNMGGQIGGWLAEGDADFATRQEQLAAAERELREKAQALEAERARWRATQQHGVEQLAREQADLNTRFSQLSQERQRLDDSRRRDEQRLSTLREEIQMGRDNHQREREALEAQWRELERTVGEIDCQMEAFEQLQAVLESRRRALEERLSQNDGDAAVTAQLEQRAARLAATEYAHAAARARAQQLFVQERANLDARWAELTRENVQRVTTD